MRATSVEHGVWTGTNTWVLQPSQRDFSEYMNAVLNDFQKVN